MLPQYNWFEFSSRFSSCTAFKKVLLYFDPSPGQFWTDPRLSFERSENLEKLVVGAEYIKLIWVPDTFFVNEKIALFHQVRWRKDSGAF